VVAALYLLLFPYHPGLRSPNELARLWQTRALVDFGTLDINAALRAYGRVGDLSVKDGRYYSSKAPLLSFAAVPLYAALASASGGGAAVPEVPLVFLSRLLLTVLPTLGLLVLLRRFLRAHLSPPVAEALALTYALGSLAFSYSLLFMSHQTVAVLLFAGFYALWRTLRGDWRGARGYPLAGAAAGAAVAAEYTAALGVVGLVLYGALGHLLAPGPTGARARALGRAAGLALLGALPFVLGLMAYHQAAFGHPLHSGYKYLADAAYQPWHLGGFLGIRTPDPRAFLLSFFSPLRGLLTLSPFLLLALGGLGRGRAAQGAEGGPAEGGPAGALAVEARAQRLFVLALLAGYTYFTSSFTYDSWGWTTGPRHLTGLLPFLLLPAGRLLERLRVRGGAGAGAGAGAAAGLCAASVLVTGALTTVNYIPDDVSDGLFGLVVPLWQAGYAVPTVASFLGVATPLAGLWVPAALLAVALAVVARLWEGAPLQRVPYTLAALAVVAAVLAVHAVATGGPGDVGAVRFLASVWLAPPGQAVPFWP
jgi:hypothetical protein